MEDRAIFWYDEKQKEKEVANMFSYILFDLDGTISDPKAGITKCVQYGLQSVGIEEPDLDKLEPFIGPPLRESFAQFYGLDPERTEIAVKKYRERFSAVGKYENVLYPGMHELLRDLQLAGAHLAIASSKPTVFVEDILVHFGIRRYFEIVVGSELDGTRDRKEDVVAEVLRQFSQRGAADPSSIVMIGDRRFDVEGAKAAGTHSIGVSYGYSAPGELEAAGAEIIVKDVEGLRRVLLGAAEKNGAAVWQNGGRESAPLQQQLYGARQNGSWRNPSADAGPWQENGMPQSYGGVYSGYGQKYRAPRPESKGKKIAKAIGACLLSMALYYLVVSVIATVVIYVGLLFFDAALTDDAYSYWLNLANAAGIVGGFAACFGIWHKSIHVRFERQVNGLSLIPLVILAAALAMGMNGVLNLIELYRYSPTYQEVAELQGDIPLWLGILSYGILAPLGEETVFRGVVYGQLKKVSNAPLAIVLSGLAFGLFHGNLVQAVYATVLGIVLALVYELYGSILFPMLFHCVANLFVYLLVDLTQIGGVFMIPVSCFFFLLISAASLVLMVKWQKGSAGSVTM